MSQEAVNNCLTYVKRPEASYSMCSSHILSRGVPFVPGYDKIKSQLNA